VKVEDLAARIPKNELLVGAFTVPLLYEVAFPDVSKIIILAFQLLEPFALD
jgi:hypothetical protein